jgi:outer membrane protein OmpA-like peptidoglycan-associated protein
LGITVLPVAAGGGQEAPAPQLTIPAQPRQYISPANGDGVQDELLLPFQEVVVPSEGMVIVEYNLSVFDGDGTVVYFQREVQAERQGFFGGLFGGEKPSVTIPENLAWDGAYNVPDAATLPEGASNGAGVPDGEYTYQLTIVDDAGRFSSSAPFKLTVDNTVPEIGEAASPPTTIFSPNGDGVLDTVTVPLSGSRELRWTVEILDANERAIYRTTTENANTRRPELDVAPPAEFVWDGTANIEGLADLPVGTVAPEGEYRLRLSGLDRAGNSAQAAVPAMLTLDLSAAELSVGVADGNGAFSPNADGRRDVLDLLFSVTDPSGLVDWQFEVLRGEQPVRSEAGRAPLPGRFTFDGRRNDGSVLPDGSYQLRIRARYENGNAVQSQPLTVSIDTVAPSASLTIETEPQATELGQATVFGAGEKSRASIELRYDSGAQWAAELSVDEVPIGGMLLEQFLAAVSAGGGAAAANGQNRVSFLWDGTLSAEAAALLPGSPRVAPDGLYQLVLRAEDAAGNVGASNLARVIKDSRTPGVTMTVDGRYLSPASTGEFARVVYRPAYEQSDSIEQFLFEIRDERNRIVRSSYQRQPFDSFEWLGLTNGGTVVADGQYVASLSIVYQNGHTTSVEGIGPVAVDRTPPRIEMLSADFRRFSPDGDGERDTVTIQQRVVPGDTWTALVVPATGGDPVVELTYEGSVQDWVWNGRDVNGQPVPDGEYRYVLRSMDQAGNRAEGDVFLTIDTVSAPISLTPPTVRLSLNPQPFSPDGDGTDERVNIAIAVETENSISSWRAEIKDPAGRLFRSFSGNGMPPASLSWDGRGTGGELVQSAMDYPVTVRVVDNNGLEGVASAPIPVDILVVRDGDRLRIQIAGIHFAANTPDLFLGTELELSKNLTTLRRLAAILNRYPEHQIVIEGYAAHVWTSSAARMQREQDEELLPLSRRRAEEVMQALIILGVQRSRLDAVGYGGLNPVVPHTDLDNLWKNRRVEFVLERGR